MVEAHALIEDVIEICHESLSCRWRRLGACSYRVQTAWRECSRSCMILRMWGGRWDPVGTEAPFIEQR